jgi:predicted component of type VI protein secretion system
MVITPPLCGPCGQRHDPTATCLPDAALSVFAPSRAENQDAVDHLEAVTVTCYRFHRPGRRIATHRPSPIALMRRAHREISSPDHRTSFAVAAAATMVAAVLALLAVVAVLLHSHFIVGS